MKHKKEGGNKVVMVEKRYGMKKEVKDVRKWHCAKGKKDNRKRER